MPTTITRAACSALAIGLLATAPVAVARHGADDGLLPAGSDDSPALRAGGDDSVSRGSDDGARARSRSRRDVRVRGTCTGRSSAKLKLSPENGRVEVEFEVDQNRVGVRWRVVLKRNGVRVASRTAVTRAPSGSFETRAVVAAGRPSTRITAVARIMGARETCRAAATLA